MNDAADSWDKYKILETTNEGDYDPQDNPCGWDADGLPENLRRHAAAISGVGKEVRAALATALAAANQSGAWKRLENDGTAVAPERIADDQFAVPGDWTWLLTARRAVRPSPTSEESGWVTAVVYEPGPNRTVVTVAGWAVGAAISELWFGQSPDNAPLVVIPEVPLTDPNQLEYLLW